MHLGCERTRLPAANFHSSRPSEAIPYTYLFCEPKSTWPLHIVGAVKEAPATYLQSRVPSGWMAYSLPAASVTYTTEADPSTGVVSTSPLAFMVHFCEPSIFSAMIFAEIPDAARVPNTIVTSCTRGVDAISAPASYSHFLLP